jgi:hypothetical protein
MNSATYQYDAFISYRRQEPDKGFARQLLKDLEDAGYQVAFDEVDFSPQATFLNEIERCCQESRFVLAVITPRYFESGNTDMEATITTVLGMSDSNNRLIPLIYEEVKRPTWMYSRVGVSFTDDDPLVPPLERLKEAMGKPQLGTGVIIEQPTLDPPKRPIPLNPAIDRAEEPTPDIPIQPPVQPKEGRKFMLFLIGSFGVLIFALGLVLLHFPNFVASTDEEENSLSYSKDSQKEERLIGLRAVVSISNLRNVESSKTIAIANLWGIEFWEIRENEGNYVFEENLGNKPILLETSSGENLIYIDLAFHPQAPNTLFSIVSSNIKSSIQEYDVSSKTVSNECTVHQIQSKHRIYSDVHGKYLAITNSSDQSSSLYVFNIANGKGVDVNGDRCESYRRFEEASHDFALGDPNLWAISALQFFYEGDEDSEDTFMITGHENGDVLKWKLGAEVSKELMPSEYFEGTEENLDSISYSSKNRILAASFQTSGQSALIKIWRNPFEDSFNKDDFLVIPSSVSGFAKELTISFNHDEDALILVGKKNDGLHANDHPYVIEVWPFSQIDSIMKDENHNIVYCNQEILDDYDRLNTVKFIFGETNKDQLIVTSGQLKNSEYAVDIWSTEDLACDN